MVIALEGLPGVGKTTSAGLVAERLGARAVTETTGDHPFLQQVYDDTDRDDLTVELTFLILHANAYRRFDRSGVTVCDFSPVKDRLFAEDMLQGGDLRLFEEVYEHIYLDHRLPEVVVYLRADPRLCLGRVRQRMRADSSRAFEAGMTLDRLRRMEARYEASLHRLGATCLTWDVPPDLGPGAVADAVAELLRERIPALVMS